MPVIVKGETYYRTSEVCAVVGVSRSTLLRWLHDGILRTYPIGIGEDGGYLLRLMSVI